MSDTTTSNCGCAFFGLLTIAFTVLKLMHVINWSWWWVLFPTLIQLFLVIVIGIVYVILRITTGKI